MAESERVGVKLYGVGAYDGCLGEASILTATDRSAELHLRGRTGLMCAEEMFRVSDYWRHSPPKRLDLWVTRGA